MRPARPHGSIFRGNDKPRTILLQFSSSWIESQFLLKSNTSRSTLCIPPKLSDTGINCALRSPTVLAIHGSKEKLHNAIIYLGSLYNKSMSNNEFCLCMMIPFNAKQSLIGPDGIYHRLLTSYYNCTFSIKDDPIHLNEGLYNGYLPMSDVFDIDHVILKEGEFIPVTVETKTINDLASLVLDLESFEGVFLYTRAQERKLKKELNEERMMNKILTEQLNSLQGFEEKGSNPSYTPNRYKKEDFVSMFNKNNYSPLNFSSNFSPYLFSLPFQSLQSGPISMNSRFMYPSNFHFNNHQNYTNETSLPPPPPPATHGSNYSKDSSRTPEAIYVVRKNDGSLIQLKSLGKNSITTRHSTPLRSAKDNNNRATESMPSSRMSPVQEESKLKKKKNKKKKNKNLQVIPNKNTIIDELITPPPGLPIPLADSTFENFSLNNNSINTDSRIYPKVKSNISTSRLQITPPLSPDFEYATLSVEKARGAAVEKSKEIQSKNGSFAPFAGVAPETPGISPMLANLRWRNENDNDSNLREISQKFEDAILEEDTNRKNDVIIETASSSSSSENENVGKKTPKLKKMVSESSDSAILRYRYPSNYNELEQSKLFKENMSKTMSPPTLSTYEKDIKSQNAYFQNEKV